MATTARERLARILGDSGRAGSFSAQLSTAARPLQLEVSGVGPVHLPVRAPLAKKLISVARPARFGRGEETLTDNSVRHTWELAPDQFTIKGPGWTALMDRALGHVAVAAARSRAAETCCPCVPRNAGDRRPGARNRAQHTSARPGADHALGTAEPRAVRGTGTFTAVVRTVWRRTRSR
jgi:hypothetical protein